MSTKVINKNEDHTMLGKPMLPIDCPSCDSLNRCYHETCQTCGNTLPNSQMPDNLETETTEEHMRKLKELDKLKSQIDSKLEELK